MSWGDRLQALRRSSRPDEALVRRGALRRNSLNLENISSVGFWVGAVRRQRQHHRSDPLDRLLYAGGRWGREIYRIPRHLPCACRHQDLLDARPGKVTALLEPEITIGSATSSRPKAAITVIDSHEAGARSTARSPLREHAHSRVSSPWWLAGLVHEDQASGIDRLDLLAEQFPLLLETAEKVLTNILIEPGR